MAHLFIVVEGVDGVGKTSVAKRLASEIGAKYILTPMAPLDEIRLQVSNSESVTLTKYINDLQDLRVRFCYYLWAVAHASHQIEKLLISNHVVCDRYISSTLAYHFALDSSLAYFNIDWLNILRPNHEYLLTVGDDEEWNRRLGVRPQQNRSDEYIENDLILLRRVEQEYRRLGLDVIDTSELTVDEVMWVILKKLDMRDKT